MFDPSPLSFSLVILTTMGYFLGVLFCGAGAALCFTANSGGQAILGLSVIGIGALIAFFVGKK